MSEAIQDKTRLAALALCKVESGSAGLGRIRRPLQVFPMGLVGLPCFPDMPLPCPAEYTYSPSVREELNLSDGFAKKNLPDMFQQSPASPTRAKHCVFPCICGPSSAVWHDRLLIQQPAKSSGGSPGPGPGAPDAVGSTAMAATIRTRGEAVKGVLLMVVSALPGLKAGPLLQSGGQNLCEVITAGRSDRVAGANQSVSSMLVGS